MKGKITTKEIKAQVQDACAKNPELADRLRQRAGFGDRITWGKMGAVEYTLIYLAYLADHELGAHTVCTYLRNWRKNAPERTNYNDRDH